MAKCMMIGLFALCVVGLLGRDARAGCVSLGGTWTCATWLKGSTEGEALSHAGEPIKCTPPNCPAVTFELRGLIDPNPTSAADGCAFPGDTGCGLDGILICLSKKCNNPDLQQCLNQGQTKGHIAKGVLVARDVTDDCSKKVCNTFRTSARLGDDVAAAACPKGLSVAEFTATKGIFIHYLCPFGSQPDGQCCASLERHEGQCVGFTDPIRACDACTLPLVGNQLPPDGTPYDCETIGPEHPVFGQVWDELECNLPGKNN
jgi:hypothetical protein